MKLLLTKSEFEALKECLKTQVKADTEVLNDHDSFSHGDWLRFEHGVKMYKAILKKMKAKNERS